MTERHIKIIEAAQAVFARYGVSKTTMNDIAREAGVARQTLYNAFDNKNDVLRAAVRLYGSQSMAVVQDAWTGCADFAQKLDVFFEHCPLAWFDMVQNAPDAADLVEGLHGVAHEELAQVAVAWQAAFEAILSDPAQVRLPADCDAADLADYIYATAISAKYNAASRTVLERRLEMLKQSVLALLAT